MAGIESPVSVECNIQRPRARAGYRIGSKEDSHNANWIIYCPHFDEELDIHLGNTISKGADPVIGGVTKSAVPAGFILETGDVMKITGYNVFQKHIEIEV